VHTLSLESALAALAIAQRSKSVSQRMVALVATCYARFYLGETDRSLEDGLAAIEFYDSSSEDRRNSEGANPVFTARAFVAMAYWQLGDYDKAAAYLADTRERLARGGATWQVAIAHLHVAWMYRLVEDRDAVLSVVSGAEPIGLQHGHRQLELHLRCLRRWAESTPGDPAFGALVSITLAELASLGRLAGSSALFLDLAETELAAGRLSAARSVANRGLEFAAESGERWLEPELWRLLVEAASLEGDRDRAAGALAAGLAATERIASRSQRLRLLTTSVRYAVKEGDKAELSSLLEGWDDHSGWVDLPRARGALDGAP
jgi:hypothetical protein